MLLADAQSLMSNRRAKPRGRLRVSAPLGIGRRFLVPRLPPFLARHPELQLERSLSDRRVNLVEEAIDVAVRIGPLADSSLMARALGKHHVVTVASPRYLPFLEFLSTVPELNRGKHVPAKMARNKRI